MCNRFIISIPEENSLHHSTKPNLLCDFAVNLALIVFLSFPIYYRTRSVMEMLEKNYRIHCSVKNIVSILFINFKLLKCFFSRVTIGFFSRPKILSAWVPVVFNLLVSSLKAMNQLFNCIYIYIYIFLFVAHTLWFWHQSTNSANFGKQRFWQEASPYHGHWWLPSITELF